MPSKLAFSDRYFRVEASDITSDTSNSVVFASLPDNIPTRLIAEWTGKQYTKLFSALFTGAHLMFPEEAGEIIWQLVKVVHKPISFTDDGNCVTFYPNNPFTTFSPQNPYTQPDFVPDGYLIPPFLVNSEEDYPTILGYKTTDVFMRPDSIPIDPIAWLTFNLPTIKITVLGSGTIELELLAVLLGGQAIIKVGSPPNIFDIVVDALTDDVTIIDLNVDSLSIPPETDITYIEEILIEAETGVPTDIYIVFIPVVDDSFVPLRSGGGIRSIELCGFEEVIVFDCEDVENCLETSPIIEAINEAITEINNQVTIINETVIELGDTVNIINDDINDNTGINPPSYTQQITAGDNYTSAACNAAYYMADRVLEFLADFWEDMATITIQELALKIIGLGGFRMESFNVFWDYYFAVSTPTLPEDAGEFRDEIAEAFFCNNLDGSDAKNYVVSNGDITEPERSGIYYAMNMITQERYNQWAYVADFTDTVEDCSEMCSWVVWWIFDNSTPEGLDEESDIVYRGDIWNSYNAEFVAGIGYRGLDDVWGIQQSLPRDCRVSQMQVNHNKIPECASVRERVNWRGTSGTDAEGFTSDATILSDTPITGDWDLHSAELNDMIIEHDHFFCDGMYGSAIHWVKMVGTGAKPFE